MSDYTLPFDVISAADLPTVGGKGANLGEMARAGFPVPPGFCVTTAAFQHWIASAAGAVYARLDALGPDDVDAARAAGAAVRAQLAALPVPGDVAQAVVAAWQVQGTDHAYAVRSSATAEDLPDASFAGQQDTFLNVRSRDDLLARLRDCWVSLFTDRAILYRAKNGFAHRSVALAVVVQRMVMPDAAGILFTADPVTSHRGRITIDAGYGLGEALVAGLVTPDLYTVDKRSGRIADLQVGDKQLAIRPDANGGTRRTPIEGAARTARVLDDAQVMELARLGTRVESHFGTPQDIEWALADGKIYLLQSRPITSLFPLPMPQPADDGLHAYFSLSHAQVMTDPMPPLALSFWRTLFPYGKGGDLRGENPLVKTAAGRLYLDITPLLLMRGLGKLIPRLLGAMADALSADALRQIMARPEFHANADARRGSLGRFLRNLLPIAGPGWARLLWLPPEGSTDRVDRSVERYAAATKARLDAAAPGAPRLRVARAILCVALLQVFHEFAPYIFAGVQAKFQLSLWGRRLGMADEAEAVARGLYGNVTTEMDLAVGDLADIARQSPALMAHLRGYDAETALATAAQVPGGSAFMAAWDRFIARYGMRGPSEIDISRPSWAEAPASLLQMVVVNLQAAPGAHRAKHAALAQAGEAAMARLVEKAAQGPWGWLRGRFVRRMARVVRSVLPVREHPKYLLIQVRGMTRRLVLDAGAQLQAQGRIDQVDDVWFLDLNELIAALEHPQQEVRSRIAHRRHDFRRYWHMTPPRVLTSEGEIVAAQYRHADLPAGALPGTPVSAGIVEGAAHVVLDPQTARLRPGEILIAPFTDPGWTPLFLNAAGLVMETGGLMTHGSVVAREYGIPAVVAVPEATRKIQTGQRVRIDGTLGYVELLDGIDGQETPSDAARAA
ncbi:MAG: phosphoenolpyruvate synthase [Caldilineaceae bacterium]|nr:phosphoenolpyruvate synthase [Caldilineaceae bacterium]